ncbi:MULTISPECIES: hypothetical protein [unclassified Mesorhizobium]|nr:MULTISPECIES: hypothetical protein [unclassified Mesorhizobium]
MKAVAIGLAAGIASILCLTLLWVPGADLWGALVGIAVGVAAYRTTRTA